MNRAKWYKVHSWVGFKLSILISFVMITGTLAVLSHEIDWLTNSAKRVPPSTVDSLDWSRVYASAKTHMPNKQLLFMLAPVNSWFSAEIIYFDDAEKRHRQFFHPTTGEYLGNGRWYNWQRFFRMSHRHLMMPTKIGVSIVGFLGLLLFITFVTSLVIYKRWWAGFFRMPRTTHRKVFWGDLHRLLGVWCLWFLLVISITAIWYLAELWGARASYPERPKAVSETALAEPTMPTIATFDSMLAQLPGLYPELVVKHVIFPSKAGQAVIFQGQAEATLVRDRVNAVGFDPVTGEHLTTIKGEHQSFHVRLSEAADPLHFGTFAGLPSKLLYFVFGIAMSTLAISGTYIYGMRVARIGKHDEKPLKRTWQSASDGMRWGKWFSVSGILICGVLTVLLFSGTVTG